MNGIILKLDQDSRSHFDKLTEAASLRRLRFVLCPSCAHIAKVHHMDWSAIVCGGCQEDLSNPIAEFDEETGDYVLTAEGATANPSVKWSDKDADITAWPNHWSMLSGVASTQDTFS